MEVYRFINYDKSNSCPDRIVDRLCHKVLIKKVRILNTNLFY